jgi:GntR family transcriptional regulator
MNVLPLYHRVFLSLREQIVNGGYDWREPLPSESQLCKEYEVSRATIRRALDLLEQEGLVDRRQGARTYIRALGYQPGQQRRNLDLVTQADNYKELFAGDIQQSYSVIETDRELARQFDKRKQLACVMRIRELKRKPFCFVITYMPLELADQINWHKIGSTPVITAVEQAGYDFVKTEQVITATVADEEAAVALDVPIGSPLLRVSGLFIDHDDRVVMRKDGYFVPDSFEYRTTIYSHSTD